MRKSIHTSDNRVLLRLLKQRRQDRGLSQAGLARELGRNQTLVSKVENGDRRLDLVELRAWLSAMHVDFLAFMRELDETIGASRVFKAGPELRANSGKGAALVSAPKPARQSTPTSVPDEN